MKTFFAFSFPTDDEAVETGRFFLHLTEFTLAWGLLGMFLGFVWAMSNLDIETIGMPNAFCLLTFLYATGLAVFVFLPIGLRLSPTIPLSVNWRLSIGQLLVGLGGFFLMRCLVLLMLLVVFQKANRPINPEEFGNVILQAAVALNPADPQSDIDDYTDPRMYRDAPCVLAVVGGWWTFRLASGKRRKMIAAPVLILIGVFWSIQNFCIMLADLDPDTIAPGFMVCTLTTLYAFVGAIGFLIADMRSNPRADAPGSCSNV
jgi:hypothetical protein